MKPDKRLANTKVYVAGKSKEIQEKAFQLGYNWEINDGIKVRYIDCPFIFFYENGEIRWSCSMIEFFNSDCKEVTADYILSLEPEPECPFKPFDKVLVRDKDTNEWSPDFFMCYLTQGVDDFNGNTVRTMSRFPYKQCIPYEGNEHLAFTTESPKQ